MAVSIAKPHSLLRRSYRTWSKMIAAWSLIQEHETLCRTTIQLIIKDQFFVIFFWVWLNIWYYLVIVKFGHQVEILELYEAFANKLSQQIAVQGLCNIKALVLAVKLCLRKGFGIAYGLSSNLSFSSLLFLDFVKPHINLKLNRSDNRYSSLFL